MPASPTAPAREPAINRVLDWLAAGRFLTFSMLIHALIVLTLGGVVLYRVAPEPPDFVGGSDGVLVESSTTPEPPSAPDANQASPQYTPSVPNIAPPPMSALVTNNMLTPTFTVASVPTAVTPGVSDSMKSALAAMNSNKPEGGGMGGMAGVAGRLGGMAKVNFFGMKTEAKRIAFLVDYSGSMEGPFRKEMEEELERSLKGLPSGTHILIIPWAGGAWLYNQQAAEIEDKWEKIGGKYDNFAIKAGKKLERPDWVAINPDNVKKLMKGIEAQKSWPGGTDWRSPFRYVMEASPPPDTIFFMTDGQIDNVDSAFAGIEEAFKKTPKPPTVFTLYIRNKGYKPDNLKRLAEKYRGELREIGPAPKK